MKKLNIALIAVLMLFQTVFMPLGTYGVAFAAGEEGGASAKGSITDPIMTLVELKQSDSTGKLVDLTEDGYRVNAEGEVTVLYTMKLPKENVYKSGDTYVLDLPEVFKFTEQHSGDLELQIEGSTNILQFGTYQVNADLKSVTFTFNKEVEGKTITGQFGAWAAFTEGVKKGELEQTIEFENPEQSFELQFAPIGGELTKTAEVDQPFNGKLVKWTVDINKASRTIRSTEVSDTMISTPANHTLVGDIEVYEITKVSMDGSVEVSEEMDEAFEEFPLDLGTIRKPYRIVYYTELNDPKTTNFTNTATLNGTESGEDISMSGTFDIDVIYADHVMKQHEVKNNGHEIEWTVLYNYDGQEIKQGYGTISDTLTNNIPQGTSTTQVGHTYVEDSIKVEKTDGTTTTELTRGKDYTVTVDNAAKNPTLRVTLTSTQQGSTAGYKLTYKTKVDQIVSDFTVSNTVREDGKQATGTVDIAQNFLIKNHEVDYEKREIKWTIRAKGFDMKNAVLVDSLDSDLGAVSNAKELSVQLTHKDGTTEKLSNTFSGNQLSFSGKTWPAETMLEVTYVTPIPEGQTETAYTNFARMNWASPTGSQIVSGQVDSTTDLKPEAGKNGYKTGTYNYSGDDYRTIDWEVGYNFNLDKQVTGAVTDTWGQEQQFVPGSKITITPVKVTATGDWEPTGEAVEVSTDSLTGNGFTLNLANVLGSKWVKGTPYILNYSTQFKDNVIPAAATNTFTFKGKNNYTLEGKVDIKYGAEFVHKQADKDSKSKYIKWTVDMNRSQSPIPNAVLTDTMTGHQQLVEDSIVIKRLEISESDELETTGKALTKGDDYTVAVDETKKQLTITFKNPIKHAYRVTYETYIANLNGNFSNTISIAGAPTLTGGSTTSTAVPISVNRSGAWGIGSIQDPFNMTLQVKKTATGNKGYDNIPENATASKPLAGAVFGLYLDGDKVIKDGKHVTVTTGADGIATFTGLTLDDAYEVKEETAPPGFKRVTTTKDVLIDDPDNPGGFKAVEFTNDKIIYDGTFSNSCGIDGTYKVEGNNQTFEIKVTDGKPAFVGTVPTITLNENLQPQFDGTGTQAELKVDQYNGKLRIQNLPPGTYTITQTEVKPGYVAGGKTTLTIAKSDTSINTKSTAIKCTPIKVTVTNVEGDPEDSTPPTFNDPEINGSTFKVYKTTEASCPGVGSTIEPTSGAYTDVTEWFDSSGLLTTGWGYVTIDFTKVKESGKYVVVQDGVKSEYHIDRSNTVVTCVEVTTTTTETPTDPFFENKREQSDLPELQLVKTDATDSSKTLSGAKIKLEGTSTVGSKKTYYGMTDEKGLITAWYDNENLTGNPVKPQADKYKVTETIRPANYGNLQVGEDSNNSEAKGTVYFDFKEKTSGVVTIKATNTPTTLTLKVTNACGIGESTYKLVKTNKDDNSIEDVLTDLSGKEIGEDGIITVGPKGFEDIYHLEAGVTYELVQLSAPAGCEYDPNTPVDSEEVPTDPKKPNTDWEVEVKNLPITTTVTNKDPEQKPIEGSTFKVYKANNENSCSLNEAGKIDPASYTDVTYLLLGKTESDTTSVVTTDAKGQFTIDWSKLGDGHFVVVQDEVNVAYKNKENVSVTFNGAPCYENSNTPPTTTPDVFENGHFTVVIKKTDAADNSIFIEGAEITLTDANSKTYTATTTKNGEAVFDSLVHGTYTITETKFPAGYEGLVTGLENNMFVLNADTKFVDGTFTIDVTNKKIERTIEFKDACTLGERVYGVYVKGSPEGTEPITTVTLTEGESIAKITIPFELTNGTTNEQVEYEVRQISSTNPDCETANVPEFPVERDDEEKTPPIVEFDGNIVELQFESCAGAAVNEEFTFTNTADNTSLKVTVDENGKAKKNIPAGTYKVTGKDMPERTVVITENSTEPYTIETKDCATVTIEFDRCDKNASQGVAIYAADANGEIVKGEDGNPLAPIKTNKPTIENGQVVTITENLPVGKYVVVALDKDGQSNFNVQTKFEVSTENSSKVVLTEDCGTVVKEVTFETCERISTTTIDVYEVTTNVDGEVEYTEVKKGVEAVKGKAPVELPVGNYIIVPGSSTDFENAKGFTVTESTETVVVVLVEIPCPNLEVDVTFEACDRIGSGVVIIYNEADEEVKRVTVANGETADVELPNGQYIAKDEAGNEVAKFTIDDATTTQLVSLNVIPCPDLEVNVTFEACDRIGSGVVIIYNEADEEVKRVTVANGKTELVTLPNGQYIAKDEAGNKVAEFTIDDKTTATQLVSFTATPCPDLEVDVTFKACDRIGSGVVIIYNEADEEVKRVTVANGGTEVVELPNGQYIAKDEAGNKVAEFTIDDKTTATQLVSLNVIPCPDLEVDVTFEACDRIGSGVVIIYDGDNKEVKRLTVANGKTELVALPNGQYIAKDEAGNEVAKFTIDDKTTTQLISLTPVPCPDVAVTVTFDHCERNELPSVGIYQGTELKGSLTKTEDGKLWTGTTNLPVGDYDVKATPEGKVLGSFTVTETTVSSSTNETITIVEDKVTLNFEQPCAPVNVPVTFDNCAKLGTTEVDVYQVSTTDSSTIVFKETVTFTETEVDGKTAKDVALTEGTYYFVPKGTPQDQVVTVGKKVEITETTKEALVDILQDCAAIQANIELVSCDKLGATVVDLYKLDSSGKLIPESKQTITVTNGSAAVHLTAGSYVAVPVGTTTFDADSTFTITNKTVEDVIQVPVKENCNGVTITFKTCDQVVANTDFTFVDTKGQTFTLTSDENGKVTTNIPPGIYTVTNSATGVVKVVDVTATITELFVVECDACTAAVTVPELQNMELTISDGKLIENVTADENGQFTVPFEDGNLTVKDATGKVVGTIKVTDCEGEFKYPACEEPAVNVPEASDNNVFILSEEDLGGRITSPDSTVLSFTTTTTSGDTTFVYTSGDTTLVLTEDDSVRVNEDGELAVDKDDFEPELEYYIVDELGLILKVITLDDEALVVSSPTREEEARFEDCEPKDPITFEPTPEEPITPPVTPEPEPEEPTTPEQPTTPPTTPEQPTTPPTTPVTPPSSGGGGGGGGSSTPPTPEATPEEPTTPPATPEQPATPGEPTTPPTTIEQSTPPAATPEQPVTPPGTPEPTVAKVVVNDPTGTPVEIPEGLTLKVTDNEGKTHEFPVDENGNYESDLPPGEYKVLVVVDTTDDSGNPIQLVSVPSKVVVKDNGEVEVTLVDPYGTVRDIETGEIIVGAKVTLHYAETPRNEGKWNELVYLPKVPNFPPYDNESPVQYTDLNGFYAYMVFPETDYYLTITKDGYKPYKSHNIAVEWEIVEHDACLTPMISNGTGIIAPECNGTIPNVLEVIAMDGERETVLPAAKTPEVSGTNVSKAKLPQTNGEAQTTAMLVGFMLVLASMYAFMTRRRKQM